MVDESREISRDENSHTFVTSETIDLPGDFVTVRSFVPKRFRRMQTYWGVDEEGAFYIIRQTDPSAKLRSQTIKEALVCIPIAEGAKTMVYFFSDFNYFQSDDRRSVSPILMNTIVHDWVRLSRTEVLTSFLLHWRSRSRSSERMPVLEDIQFEMPTKFRKESVSSIQVSTTKKATGIRENPMNVRLRPG